MTPRRRLVLGCLIAIAGAVVAAIGARSAWATLSIPGRQVAFPGPAWRVEIGSVRELPVGGTDLSDLLLPGAVVAGLASGAALLVGPRGRPWLLAAAALGAGTVLGAAIARGWSTGSVRAVTVSGSLTTGGVEIRPAGGRWVTVLGSAAVLAAIAPTVRAAARVPRLGMPEGPPPESPA